MSLPDEVVEQHIMERLPVKSLLRFKCVSRQWKSAIESRFFQERQLRHHQKYGDPDVLMATTNPNDVEFRRVVLGSSSSVTIPIPWKAPNYFMCQSSCDGIVCLYRLFRSCFLFNPTTRWHRNLPLCRLQRRYLRYEYDYPNLAQDLLHFVFGKDKFTGTYKTVVLDNSYERGQENATKCEVFDFSTNAWRYVTPASPYQIVIFSKPVYVDGSIHWFSKCKETKVLSLDLHTEAFQVTKAPFTNARINEMVMCNLHNRLCVSVMNSSKQVIWSFNSDNKTWDIMGSVDVTLIRLWYGIPKPKFALLPLALLDAKKKLLFYDRQSQQRLMTYDFETKLYDSVFSSTSPAFPICYYQSLFSAS